MSGVSSCWVLKAWGLHSLTSWKPNDLWRVPCLDTIICWSVGLRIRICMGTNPYFTLFPSAWGELSGIGEILFSWEGTGGAPLHIWWIASTGQAVTSCSIRGCYHWVRTIIFFTQMLRCHMHVGGMDHRCDHLKATNTDLLEFGRSTLSVHNGHIPFRHVRQRCHLEDLTGNAAPPVTPEFTEMVATGTLSITKVTSFAKDNVYSRCGWTWEDMEHDTGLKATCPRAWGNV